MKSIEREVMEVSGGKMDSNRGWCWKVGGGDDGGLSSCKCSEISKDYSTARDDVCMAHMPPSL